MAKRILQELEMRYAVLAYRYKLAVDDGIAFDAFEGLCDFDVAMTDDFAVATIEHDLAALDLSDHAEAVVLVLEYPALLVEWHVGKRREHRLQPFRQC